MSVPVDSIVFGAIFGLALAAPPGPMNAVIAEETVRRGWHAGFAAGLGAMVADLCFLALAILGVVTVVRSMPAVRGVMVGIGGLLMLAFAYDAARNLGDAGSPRPAGREETTGGAARQSAGDTRGFWKALTLALTNPYQIVFWLTVGVKLLEPGTEDFLARVPLAGEALAGMMVVRTGSPALLVGLFLGIAVWIVAFPASLVAGRRRTDRFALAVAGSSAVLLALFGVWFLLDAASTLG